MATDFEKHAMKGNEFLNLLSERLGDEGNREHAFRVLRSVLRTLRRHLTATESFQLLAQLPMAVKSVYVDGWAFNQLSERIHTFDDMVNEIVKEEGPVAWKDFSNREDVIQSIRAVVETMALYVSKDELEEAFGTLPKGLKETFTSWV